MRHRHDAKKFRRYLYDQTNFIVSFFDLLGLETNIFVVAELVIDLETTRM